MRTALAVTAVYGLGLLVLLMTGLAVGMQSDEVDWVSIVGLALMAAGASLAAGFLAGHWIVLTPPLALAGILFAFAVLLLSGDPGDGGPAAVAAVLLPTIAILFVVAAPAGLGLALHQRLRRPAAAAGDDTH